jgi:hypothetical protein
LVTLNSYAHVSTKTPLMYSVSITFDPCYSIMSMGMAYSVFVFEPRAF